MPINILIVGAGAVGAFYASVCSMPLKEPEFSRPIFGAMYPSREFSSLALKTTSGSQNNHKDMKNRY